MLGCTLVLPLHDKRLTSGGGLPEDCEVAIEYRRSFWSAPPVASLSCLGLMSSDHTSPLRMQQSSDYAMELRKAT